MLQAPVSISARLHLVKRANSGANVHSKAMFMPPEHVCRRCLSCGRLLLRQQWGGGGGAGADVDLCNSFFSLLQAGRPTTSVPRIESRLQHASSRILPRCVEQRLGFVKKRRCGAEVASSHVVCRNEVASQPANHFRMSYRIMDVQINSLSHMQRMSQ